MKKFIYFTILLIGFFATNHITAQDRTTPTTLAPGKTLTALTLTAADTIVASDTYWVYTKTLKDVPATQDVLLKLTKVSGTPRVAAKLYGRKFTTSDWTQIGSTVTWYATATDTTIVISNATDNRYREYKTELTTTATAQKSRLTKFEFKEYY